MGLRELRSLTLDNHSLEEVIAGVFRYASGFFWPDQVFEEILETAREVASLRPRYVLEIGTDAGGTLLMWSRIAHPEAVIVSIDLPGAQAGTTPSRLRDPLFLRMGLPGQRIHLIRGNSHHPATLEKARLLIGRNLVDFLYIDGDHTEEGVRADYEMYGPLVRPGGLIAFHDIVVDSPQCGVARFWRELRQTRPTRSIVAFPPRYGIGLVPVPLSGEQPSSDSTQG
jgi:cephalosporin hydroxylase